MTSSPFVLLAFALLLWPRRGSPARGGPGAGDPFAGPPAAHPISAARRERIVTAAAVAGLGLALVVVLGPRAGLPAATLVCPSVWLALGRLARRPTRAAPDRGLALALDLVAAVLRSGRPLADALAAAAPAARAEVGAVLMRVSRLLAFGAQPAQAWSAALRHPDAQAVGPLLEPVVAVAVRSQDSGIRLADAFERLAVDVRADCAAAAVARANRAGVHAMAPLAACFLPSFVCLGIVPVVVGVASTALHGVR